VDDQHCVEYVTELLLADDILRADDIGQVRLELLELGLQNLELAATNLIRFDLQLTLVRKNVQNQHIIWGL
jgi:hypothetical protein